jgi:hypothetical protein
MKLNRITLEYLLYALAFVLAVGLRLLNLGVIPLSDAEAGIALYALDLSKGESISGFATGQSIYGPMPGYVSLSALLFYLFGSSEALARLLPALVGSLLTIVPLCFRNLVNRKSSLVLAFALALGPGFVAISRLADGPILALVFGLWALGFGYSRRPLSAGIFAGLALLSGPSVIHGYLGLILAIGVMRLVDKSSSIEIAQEKGLKTGGGYLNTNELKKVVFSAVATILIVGTLFALFPQGLSAWVTMFPNYLRGWIEPSGVPAVRVLTAFLVYQPLGLIFGLMRTVQGWRRHDRIDQLLSLWFLFAIVGVLIYPARQVGDLLWAIVPLWTLAAREIAMSFSWDSDQSLISLAQAALIFVLMALSGLNLRGLSTPVSGTQEFYLRLAVVAGLIGLIILVTALVSYGWSRSIARQGLVWGLCAALGIVGLSNMWSASQLQVEDRFDLWSPLPTIADADLLLSTIKDLSSWNTGYTDAVDVTVQVNAPSMYWALRDLQKVSIVPETQPIAMSAQPSIVITRQAQETPSLAASYRGQDFAWWNTPGWLGALPPDFFRWLTFRQAPLQQEQVILWARVDLFPEEIPESGLEVNTIEGVELDDGDVSE